MLDFIVTRDDSRASGHQGKPSITGRMQNVDLEACRAAWQLKLLPERFPPARPHLATRSDVVESP